MPLRHLVQTAAKLYECRDTMKFLLGDKYKAAMEKTGEEIKHVMVAKKCDEVMAAVELAKEVNQPMATIRLLAAAVELVEPGGGE
jgi:hypothetical protein